ncbi:MAG: phospholipase D family protein [Gammaproteobacteria bacterium]|nr:phospholipase D family protein [Gammaproteobacteria bacterium]
MTELLQTHTHFDIATAWAWDGEHLEMLEAETKRRGLEVRAIVGIAGNATHPDALDKLNRIARGRLRIVPNDSRLFHPKLYLFARRRDGIVTRRAWIGSANFTKAGFGRHAKANEELVVEIGFGDTVDALAAWFQERWDHCATDMPIAEVIRRYSEVWKPPNREVRGFVSKPVTRRAELLEDAPRTFDHYHQALRECDEMLRDRDWGVFHQEHGSYMAAIRRRRAILFGETRWSDLDPKSQRELKGSYRREGLEWWGLLGRIVDRGGTWPAACNEETKFRRVLERVKDARETMFPDIAVSAMRELTVRHVNYGTTTLLLTLTRPDRLLSVNRASEKTLGELAGIDPSTLRKPEGYGNLLQWLYDQPWYADGPPANEDLVSIWRFRAGLVDAFVSEY